MTKVLFTKAEVAELLTQNGFVPHENDNGDGEGFVLAHPDHDRYRLNARISKSEQEVNPSLALFTSFGNRTEEADGHPSNILIELDRVSNLALYSGVIALTTQEFVSNPI